MYGGWSIEGLGILGLGSVLVSHWNSPISIVINANLMQLRIDNSKNLQQGEDKCDCQCSGGGGKARGNIYKICRFVICY